MKTFYPQEGWRFGGLLGFSLLVFALICCQPLFADGVYSNVQVRAHQDSKMNLANVLNPLTSRSTARIQIESSQGLELRVSNFKLPRMIPGRPRVSSTSSLNTLNPLDRNYTLPGEFSLTWHWNHGSFEAGRRRLDSPFFQTDDTLLVPNIFESVTVNYDVSSSLRFSAMYLNAVSDWNLGDETIPYIDIGSHLETSKTSGATVFSAQFSSHGFSAQSWYYHLPDLQDIGYLELGYSFNLGSSVAIQLNSQVDRVRSTGAGLLGDVKSTTVGFQASLAWSNISFFASYNQLLAGASTAVGIGGDPYYTSLQYRSFADLNNANSVGVAAGFTYSVKSIPLEVDVAMARYRGAQGQYDMSELDLGIDYGFSKVGKLGVFFSQIDDKIGRDDDYRLLIGLNVQL